MKYDAKIRGGAAALLGLVLTAGIALGIAVDRSLLLDTAAPASEPPEPSRPVEPPNEWVIDRLDLTSEQRASVDSVIAHYGVLMSAFQDEYRPRYRAIVDSTARALKGILTSNQRLRYDSLEDLSRRWRERNRSEAQRR